MFSMVLGFKYLFITLEQKAFYNPKTNFYENIIRKQKIKFMISRQQG